MNKLFLLVSTTAIALCVAGCSSKNEDEKINDLISENVKGNVKEIKTITYQAKDVDEKAVRTDVVLASSQAFFDKEGNKAEFAENENYEAKPTKEKHDFKYNDKGNRAEAQISTDKGENAGKLIHNYDDKGIHTETIQYDDKGEVECKYVYPQDVKKGTTETLIYNGDGTLKHKYVITLDESGHHNKLEVYNAAEELISSHTYVYELDEQDNWVTQFEYHYGKPLRITDREIIYY